MVSLPRDDHNCWSDSWIDRVPSVAAPWLDRWASYVSGRESCPVRNFRAMVEKSAKLHILIVDDEALIRWSIGETLASGGHDVSEAGNAKEALQRLSAG